MVPESPAAYRTIRRILPLLSERLLQERFMNCQLHIRHALTDIEDMDFLIEIWREANGSEQVMGSIPVILSVDAVAFRPRITIDENEKVEGLERFTQLEAPYILSQFVLNPCTFRDFVMEHFKQAYSSLFVYQVQPVDPRLTCCLVHATAAIHGKGNESTTVALEAISTQLRERLFTVLEYAFDGDQCFNRLHNGFQDA
jgi:hypothetical protein